MAVVIIVGFAVTLVEEYNLCLFQTEGKVPLLMQILISCVRDGEIAGAAIFSS